MANLNKVMLIGNLTRDPETRHTAKGTAVAEFGLAINRKTKDDSGNVREDVTFIDVTVWGRTAELAGKYLVKGKSVLVEGRLHMDTWQDRQTGQNRQRLKVVGEAIQFLTPQGGTGQPRESGRAQQGGNDSSEWLDDEDIPF